MKVNILFSFKNGPSGGGNHFLSLLHSEYLKMGIYENDPIKSDIVIVNSYHNLIKAAKLKNHYPNIKLVFRLGPIFYYHRGNIWKLMDKFIEADIKNLPFKENSIDGIWNVGVMEHFSRKEVNEILNEFYRVLKNDSSCVLFWPGKFGPTNLIFRPLEFILKKIKKSSKGIAPKEPSIIKSKKLLKNQIINETNFKNVKIFLSPRALFVHYIVICKK